MKLMLISAFAMLFLVSCGGGTDSNSNSNSISSTNLNTGVAQKGPFTIGSKVIITKLDSSGISTGSVIESKISSISGSFSYGTNNSDSNAYYRIQATGSFFDENIGTVSEKEIKLSTITNNPKNSSINVLTHWQSQRTDALLAYDKTFKASLDQSQKELFKIFGIQNSHALDITTSSNQLDEDNALLLLLSGALMEASQKYRVSSQIIIDEIGKDFADDGQLSEKGDDWFIRLQALIKNDPSAQTKKYAKAINDELGLSISLNNQLPTLIPLASRPVANIPPELLAQPSEIITLDGSASHDSGDIINFTWFRVDQQTQYDIQVSDRFSATPTITMPDEDTVLAAPNQEISLLYALVVTDADKLTHTGIVKVTVKVPPPLNNPPITDSQTLITDEDTPLAITLTASDIDGDAINFVLSTPLSTPNGLVELDTSLPNIVYTPTQDYFGTDSFTFIVNDGFANSNTATIDIQVNPINDPPIADAGIDQTAESLQAVSLNGSGFDVDGTVDAYLWEQTGGSLVSLSDSAIPNPDFTAPDISSVSETLSFDLIVTDNDGENSIAATVDFVINPMNVPPVANAGLDQDVFSGDLVTLNGSGTDLDGDIVGYAWTHSNTAISLSDASISNPTFTAPAVLSAPETLTFDLVVTDDDGDQSIINSVDIVVNPPVNNRPIANAGPDQTITSIRTNFGGGFIESTPPITLDGSGSTDTEDDLNGIPLAYNWIQVSGPISIDPDNLMNPIFNISAANQDIDGNYVFRLVVTDSDGLPSDSEDVLITVTPLTNTNIPPNAIATYNGNPPFNELTVVELVGGESFDNDGNIVSYFWEQIGIPTVLLSDPNIANPTFTAPSVLSTPLTLTFSLTVTDNDGTPDSDTVDIEVVDSGGNRPPIADAGVDRTEPILTQVNLFGSGTDSDGFINGYEWSQTSGTPVFVSDSFTAIARINTPNLTSPEDLVFELIVTDNEGLLSVAATITITVDPGAPANARPIANAFSVNLNQGTSRTIPQNTGELGGEDTDGDVLTIIDVSQPNNGVLDIVATTFGDTYTYTPNTDYCGTDSFDYRVHDGHVVSLYARVTLNVNCQPLTGGLADIVIDPSGVNIILLSGTDSDGTIATYEIVTPPMNGFFDPSFTLPNLFYTQNNFFPPDPDSFTYRVIDNQGLASEAETVNLIFGNNPPIASEQTLDIPSIAGLTINLNDYSSDPDGDSITFELVGNPYESGVTLSFSINFSVDGMVVAEPLDSGVEASFQYRVIDEHGARSSIETIFIRG